MNLTAAGHGSGWCGEEYLAAVDVMDEQLGVILDSIEGQDVLVALSSDHGGIGGYLCHDAIFQEFSDLRRYECNPVVYYISLNYNMLLGFNF